ncbi:MAG: electron transfer flavoprotein-ubiquinone oxidoreductase [Acidobacteriota bacterium]
MSAETHDDIEREELELDVLFVGAGPASLAGAYHLGKLIEAHNEAVEKGGDGEPLEVAIAVLEKGQEISSHALSGAVVNPRAFQELMPDTWEQAPFEAPVTDEKFFYMTESKALSMPIPPPLKNDGKYVASLGKLMKWLAPQVEDLEIDIFCEFPASQALIEEAEDGSKRVVGVRTGDRGIDKHGQPKPSFEPGVDIKSKVVVLGEGPRGTLAKQLEAQFPLTDGRNPQVYAIGIKEIWELPPGRIKPGFVAHTLGFPLGWSTFGGGFIYGMDNDQAIVGIVVGLDYKNPYLDPHNEFNRFKTNGWVRELLDGGKMTFYGAKAIPEGGWFSMPRGWGDGFLLCGDSGGFLDNQRLKGVHLAMKSGMLAAETIFEGLRDHGGELPESALARYEEKVESSWIFDEMWPNRNFHQGFEHGVVGGMLQTGLGMVTGGLGWGFLPRLGMEPGHEKMKNLTENLVDPPPQVEPDGELTFDKVADVYNSGAAHEEDQPVHLLVADTEHCVTVCAQEYANPCQRFCPANVYEIVDDAEHETGKRLQINASNCVHCKTCDIMDPYQIITWVPPEGGGGPSYSKM